MLFNFNKQTELTENKVKQVIESGLKEGNIKFEYDSLNNRFVMNIVGRQLTWHCIIYPDYDRCVLLIRSFYPISVIDGKALKMAEMAARCNEDILLGKFNLNFESGSISLDTIHLFADSVFTEGIFRTLISTNLVSAEEYFRLFAAVNFGDEEPALLIQQIKTNQRHDNG
jgi:hypothetical protein